MRNPAVHDELDVAQTTHIECTRNANRVRHDAVAHVVNQLRRGICRHRVTAVHPGALDVLHEPGDDDSLSVADGIDVDLGAEEIPIDEHGTSARARIGRESGHGRLEITLHRIPAVHDLHRPAAEHV